MLKNMLLISLLSLIWGDTNAIKSRTTTTTSTYFNPNHMQYCICVPFWQCKEDSSDVNEDGIDLVDIRVINNTYYYPTIPTCSGDFDICCKINCGERGGIHPPETVDQNDAMRSRILGDNNEATFAEFPWMLGIIVGHAYRCGASLIHPNVAVTAAHCVHDAATGTQYRVRAGEWNWDSNEEPQEHQERVATSVIVHEHYHASSLRNDIALLLFEEPFTLMENVGLICLPRNNAAAEGQDGRKCMVTGWGRSSLQHGRRSGANNYHAVVLKKLELPLVGRGLCTDRLRQMRFGPMFLLHRSFLCAGGEENRDACKGDGGSPLVCPVVGHDGTTRRYEQVGIVSWGLSCGLKNTPGVYVNVALYVKWIYSKLMKHYVDMIVNISKI